MNKKSIKTLATNGICETCSEQYKRHSHRKLLLNNTILM